VVDATARAKLILQVSHEGLLHFLEEHEGELLRVFAITQAHVNDALSHDVATGRYTCLDGVLAYWNFWSSMSILHETSLLIAVRC
jgi:hypothetical protein